MTITRSDKAQFAAQILLVRLPTIRSLALTLCLTLGVLGFSAVETSAARDSVVEQIEALRRSGKIDEAVEVAGGELRASEQALGAGNHVTGGWLNRIATLHLLAGRSKEAEAYFERAIGQIIITSQAERSVVSEALRNLLQLYISQGRFADANEASLQLDALPPPSQLASGAPPRPADTAPVIPDGQPTAEASPAPGRPDALVPETVPQTAVIADNEVPGDGESPSPSNAPAEAENAPSGFGPVASLAVPAEPAPVAGGDPTCENPSVTGTINPFGIAELCIKSGCRAGEPLKLLYGSIESTGVLDENGEANINQDLFAGLEARVLIEFQDGKSSRVELPAFDFSGVSKVAIVWSADVNLDLHAFEYAADFNTAGHIWAGHPLTAKEVDDLVRSSSQGHGTITTAGDGSSAGTNFEVYTLVHKPEQDAGAVKMAVDYASRGDVPSPPYCGSHEKSSVLVDVYQLVPNQPLTIETVEIAAAECGKALPTDARYIWSVIPDIRIRDE